MDLFFELIQVSIGRKDTLSRTPLDKEWAELFDMAKKHAVAGVAFLALEKLSKEGQKLPLALLYEWIALSERIKQQNMLMNIEAARLTKLFESEGHQTVILKGQANSLLYPNLLLRQPGDIDIWVSGGRERVVETLKKVGLLKDGLISEFNTRGNATISYHHIHLPKNENGIDVEVHFRPSSGNSNPFTNRRLQAYLIQELNRENKMVEEGFRVPSQRFALVMQLAHIQRHLLTGGVGLRQLIDYFYLLQKAKDELTIENGKLIINLQNLGLEKIVGAVMWVIKEVFGLKDEFLIAPVDEKRGKMMLRIVMEGGNFGHYNPNAGKTFSWSNHVRGRFNGLKLFRFDASEVIWCEIRYAQFFLRSITERVRRRSWSLGVSAKEEASEF